jgi:hypothetical protein
MSWKDILKEDDEWVEDYGFIEDDFTSVRDSEGNLTNWFKTIERTFQTMLDSIGFSTETNPDDKEPGFKQVRRNRSNSSRKISELGQEITKGIIDSMLEGYVKSITKNAKEIDDDANSIQSIMSQSGYGRTIDAALKFSEEFISEIFDANYRSTRAKYDRDAMKKPDDKMKRMNLDITGDVPDEFINSEWASVGNEITSELKEMINMIDNVLDDVVDSKASFDLDNDGTNDIDKKDIVREIKTNLSNFFNEGSNVDMVKDFSGNVAFSFTIKYAYMPGIMEADEEVSDQSTEEDAEEMRNRPEIQARELNEEERREFEDEFKSNDNPSRRYKWESILLKETAMTSMQGFTPALHNVSYGDSCCDECAKKKKESSCGCGE